MADISLTQDKIVMRLLEAGDLPVLRDFFLKVFGPETVFQDLDFLKWYYFTQNNFTNKAAGSIICLDTDQNKVASFYGGLQSELYWFGQTAAITWGVSAFTLPEYRGNGLNSGAVKLLGQTRQVHGVIGFLRKAAGFYQNNGYHLFDFRRFKRYIYTVSEENVKTIIQYIHPEAKMFPVRQTLPELSSAENSNFVKLTADNIHHFKLDFPYQVSVTTLRDKNYILKRFIEHPNISYQVYGYQINNRIIAYVAYRVEELRPMPYKCCRIIDLFGQSAAVAALARFVAATAQNQELAYVDFSAFGDIYKNALKAAG